MKQIPCVNFRELLREPLERIDRSKNSHADVTIGEVDSNYISRVVLAHSLLMQNIAIITCAHSLATSD